MVEVSKVDRQRNHRHLFNARANTAEGRMEVPIEIEELDSALLDEAAVLRSPFPFVENLAASVRLQLAAACNP